MNFKKLIETNVLLSKVGNPLYKRQGDFYKESCILSLNNVRISYIMKGRKKGGWYRVKAGVNGIIEEQLITKDEADDYKNMANIQF